MLKQVRFGFATNSSSCHSVILANSPQDDYEPNDAFKYGWENFILASEQAKRDYLYVQTRDSFFGKPEWDEYIALLRPSPGYDKEGWHNGFDGYIDHESQGLIGGSSLKNLQGTLKWLLAPCITILGGSDNYDHEFYIQGKPIDTWMFDGATVREEPEGRVLFNSTTGAKFHLFNADVDFSTYIASAPELVDIKITDWCDLGCRFCYQDSTRKGKHAPFEVIQKIIDDLSSAGVFEVALGGGEPASHPQFEEILKYCSLKGIVPNFTTRNYALLKTDNFLRWSKLAGSVGISIANATDVCELLAEIPEGWKAFSDLSLQVACGAQTADEFRSMIELIKMASPFTGLILLGYKDVGRGSRAGGDRWYEKEDIVGMVKGLFRSYSSWRVSMDTEMARSTKDQLAHHNVNPAAYMEHEGRVSCYIDAVSMKIGPSSYGDSYRPYCFNLMSIWRPMADEYLNAHR